MHGLERPRLVLAFFAGPFWQELMARIGR